LPKWPCPECADSWSPSMRSWCEYMYSTVRCGLFVAAAGSGSITYYCLVLAFVCE
jgi:hypothetical protein